MHSRYYSYSGIGIGNRIYFPINSGTWFIGIWYYLCYIANQYSGFNRDLSKTSGGGNFVKDGFKKPLSVPKQVEMRLNAGSSIPPRAIWASDPESSSVLSF